MAQLFWLRREQIAGIRPLFPKERGVKRVDDRKVLSGIILGPGRVCAGRVPWPSMAPIKSSTTVSAVRQGCF